MEAIIRILMCRDGITLSEAIEIYDKTREALMDGDYDAIYEYCGLEDDYIFCFL